VFAFHALGAQRHHERTERSDWVGLNSRNTISPIQM
jgi:hypothetical protein